MRFVPRRGRAPDAALPGLDDARRRLAALEARSAPAAAACPPVDDGGARARHCSRDAGQPARALGSGSPCRAGGEGAAGARARRRRSTAASRRSRAPFHPHLTLGRWRDRAPRSGACPRLDLGAARARHARPLPQRPSARPASRSTRPLAAFPLGERAGGRAVDSADRHGPRPRSPRSRSSCAYLLGSIPFSYLVARRKGDRRAHGGQRQRGRDERHAQRGQAAGADRVRPRLPQGRRPPPGWRCAVAGPTVGPALAAVVAVLGHMYPVWLALPRRQGRGHRRGRVPAPRCPSPPWPALADLRAGGAGSRATSPLGSIAGSHRAGPSSPSLIARRRRRCRRRRRAGRGCSSSGSTARTSSASPPAPSGGWARARPARREGRRRGRRARGGRRWPRTSRAPRTTCASGRAMPAPRARDRARHETRATCPASPCPPLRATSDLAAVVAGRGDRGRGDARPSSAARRLPRRCGPLAAARRRRSSPRPRGSSSTPCAA